MQGGLFLNSTKGIKQPNLFAMCTRFVMKINLFDYRQNQCSDNLQINYTLNNDLTLDQFHRVAKHNKFA